MVADIGTAIKEAIVGGNHPKNLVIVDTVTIKPKVAKKLN